MDEKQWNEEEGPQEDPEDEENSEEDDLEEVDPEEEAQSPITEEEPQEEGLDNEILAELEEIDKDLEPLGGGQEPGEAGSEEGEGAGEEEEAGEDELSGEASSDEAEGGLLSGEEGEFDETEGELGEDDSDLSADEGEAIDEAELAEMEKQSEEVDAHEHMKNVVEGALFVAGRPVSLEELNSKTDIGKRDLESLLDELAMDYLVRSTALEIIRIQDKYSLQIKPEYTPRVKKFASGGLIPDRILKTLTIIALKQPLMKSMLVKIRGSTAYEHVKFLIDRGFIEAHRKGRSSELLTTDQFADTFGLSRDIATLKKQMITQLGIQEK